MWRSELILHSNCIIVKTLIFSDKKRITNNKAAISTEEINMGPSLLVETHNSKEHKYKRYTPLFFNTSSPNSLFIRLNYLSSL